MTAVSQDNIAGRKRRAAAISLPSAIVLAGVVLAALLVLPGQTVTTKYVNDLFIFLDGAYRIVEGQVPNIDFHTSLGPLAFLLPALGYWLTGSLGAAMPVGMGIAVLAFALLGAHVIGTRMPAIVGLPLAIVLLLIVAVPLNPGERLADLSFAMFYNRIGWATLGLMLVFHLPPRSSGRGQALLDAISAAVLTLVLIYMKISYGLVAVAFLLFLLSDRRQWRVAAAALALILASGLVVELLWRGTAAYWADIELARAVSGDLPDLPRLVGIVLDNLRDVAVFMVFATVLAITRRSLRDLAFAAFCLSTGVLILEQNFQMFGILTLIAAAAVIVVRIGLTHRAGAGLLLLLAVPMLPLAVQYSGALLLHAGLAATDAGAQMPMPGFRGVRLAELGNTGRYRAFTDYNRTLAEGADELARLDIAPERVLVLDFVGPFTAGMGLVPVRGDFPWYHWGRTLGSTHFLPPDELFADAGIVMDPKFPVEHWTTEGMRCIYGPFIEQQFRLVRDTASWRIYERSDSGSGSPAVTSTTRHTTSAQP